MNKLIYFKFLAVLLTSLWGIQQASAYDFAKDGIYYVINGTNAYVTYKDTNYNSYSGTVNIPSTVTNNGTTYNVVQINPYAFKNCANLKRVVLPPHDQLSDELCFPELHRIDRHHVACQLLQLLQLCV